MISILFGLRARAFVLIAIASLLQPIFLTCALADQPPLVWHGVGVQNSGSRWSMQLDLRKQQPVATYPSLKCRAAWEKVHEGRGYIDYFERVVENRKGCIDGFVRVYMLDGKRLAFEFSSKPGKTPLARAILRPGFYKSGNDRALLAATEAFIASDRKLALAPSVSRKGDLAMLMLGMIAAGIAAGATSKRTNGTSGTAAPATAQDPSPAPVDPSGVTMDGDGWVDVDGRRIGRVTVSYGYNIICSNGYRYGSDSAFGGSFKADVGSKDAAVAVLLDACKR